MNQVRREQVTHEEIHLQMGIPEALRTQAAELFDEAFGQKLSVAVKDRDKRLSLLEKALNLQFAVAAISQDRLVGLAGYHTPEGTLTEGLTEKSLLGRLGLLRGTWAAWVFSLYERKLQPKELVMDGIAVSRNMRGKGIGACLLGELKQLARDGGYTSIRLDVIDSNPDAKRLYHRQGFRPIRTEKFEYLRWLLGFGASTTMVYDLDKQETPR